MKERAEVRLAVSQVRLSPLQNAVHRGDLGEVERLLNARIQIDARGPAGRQALHLAAEEHGHGTPELVELYKPVIGEVLVECGYERDLDWDRERGTESSEMSTRRPA